VKFTRELADLAALIPDLQAKADDAADCAKNAQHDKEALAAAIVSFIYNGCSLVTNAIVSLIYVGSVFYCS